MSPVDNAALSKRWHDWAAWLSTFRQQTWTKATHMVSGLLPDAFYLSGMGLISYGIWMAWHPAGFMFAGAVLVNLAFKIEQK